MTKKDLRKIYRDKRAGLSAKDISVMTDLILINFQKLHLPFLSCAHTYIASEKLGEVETIHLTHFLKFQNPGLKIVVPKIDTASGRMDHLHFDAAAELDQNLFGIAEPREGITVPIDEIDMVLVPLLAFDAAGFRVGYGKGYYDKFLSECREDVLKIGLSFFEAEEHIDDVNQFDIPLNYCITPQRIYNF